MRGEVGKKGAQPQRRGAVPKVNGKEGKKTHQGGFDLPCVVRRTLKFYNEKEREPRRFVQKTLAELDSLKPSTSFANKFQWEKGKGIHSS